MEHIQHPDAVQTLSLANCFELVYREDQPREKLSELENIDDLHCGQKSAFWSLSNCRNTAVVTPSSPSNSILDHFGDAFFGPLPTFISPRPLSSSLISNLLRDEVALAQLTDCLSPYLPVRLLPHIHTAQVELLSDWLISRGYLVLSAPRHASLVRALCDKLYAHDEVFLRDPDLAKMRPESCRASNLPELALLAAQFRKAGKTQFVVKSAIAVAGTGTYFLSTSAAEAATSLETLLLASPGIQPTRQPPFLIEEYVPAVFSPTVDIDVDANGRVTLSGVAIQRLREGKFYTGFHFSPEMTGTAWYRLAVQASITVGRALASIGYFGPANVDFVVARDGTIKLIELNPRHSALFDGFQIAVRKHGRWNSREFSVADHLPFRTDMMTEEANQVLDPLRSRGDICVIADTSFPGHVQNIALWVSSYGESSELLLNECARLLSGRDVLNRSTRNELLPLMDRPVWRVEHVFKAAQTVQSVDFQCYA